MFCWRPDYSLQELNTLYLTRFRTYKIATPLQTKTWERDGLLEIPEDVIRLVFAYYFACCVFLETPNPMPTVRVRSYLSGY
jgi:hypothetical protein